MTLVYKQVCLNSKLSESVAVTKLGELAIGRSSGTDHKLFKQTQIFLCM